MATIIANRVWTSVDDKDVGHVMVEVNGEEIQVTEIIGISQKTADEVHDMVDFYLKLYDIKVEEPKTKERRKKVTLGFANDYGKVTLKLANKEPLKPYKIIDYVLYIKGTKQYVYRLDEKGIYVIREGGKTPPVHFTKEDIAMIKNIDDFDVVKVERVGKKIFTLNKIAPKKGK